MVSLPLQRVRELSMRDFHDLMVWQRAHALSLLVYRAVSRSRRREHEGLRSQLRRAADSIAANIVEGCGAASRKEFARFLDIAIKSASEVEYHLLVARDHGVVAHDAWQSMTGEVIEIRKMTHGLRKKVLATS